MSTGAFGLDFSLFISVSILLQCSYLRKIPPGFAIKSTIKTSGEVIKRLGQL